MCCVAVDRGLYELRKLAIEQQLWEASRKEIDHPALASLSNHKYLDNTLWFLFIYFFLLIFIVQNLSY